MPGADKRGAFGVSALLTAGFDHHLLVAKAILVSAEPIRSAILALKPAEKLANVTATGRKVWRSSCATPRTNGPMPANWGRNEIGEHSVPRAYCWSLCSLPRRRLLGFHPSEPFAFNGEIDRSRP